MRSKEEWVESLGWTGVDRVALETFVDSIQSDALESAAVEAEIWCTGPDAAEAIRKMKDK